MGACASQGRALGPLELEFQVVVICHVGAGNPIEAFFKGSTLSTAEPSLYGANPPSSRGCVCGAVS